MSNSFIQSMLASAVGIGLYFVLEAAYYEIKARIEGKRYERFLEDYEDDHWDD